MENIEKWLQIFLSAGNLMMSFINRFWPRRPDCKPKEPAPQQRKKLRRCSRQEKRA